MTVRKSPDERKAIVEAVLKLGGGLVLAENVRNVADHFGVTERTLYRWLRDDSPAPEAAAERFEVDTAMITVLAQEQTLKAAFDKLVEAGIVDVSYPTFCRAMNRQDPALVRGALSGRKELAANRVYLQKSSPHRCHTYFLDHTQLDIWVLPTHKHTSPIRPHLTVIGDAHSGYLWTFVWYKKPNGSDVAAALASTCLEDLVNGVSVGGIPQQVIMDNAAEHFGQDVRGACTAMGIVVAPTSAYSSWQNGQAERAVGLVNRMVTADAPGAVRTGSDTSSTRFLATTRSNTDLDNLWSANSLEIKVREVTRRINVDMPRKTRGGLTRLQLFSHDETDRLFLTPEASRLVSLRTHKESFRASKSGIQFKNRHYVSAEVSPGRSYKVRYLPGVTTYIELFTEDGKHIGRAFNQESLPKSERNNILKRRARTEHQLNGIEEGVKAHRRKQAAVDNSELAVMDDSTDKARPTFEESVSRDPVAASAQWVNRTCVPVAAKLTASELRATEQDNFETMSGRIAQDLIAQASRLNAARDHKNDGDHSDE